MSADIIARCLARLSVLQSEALLISALKGGPSETVEQETVFSNREVTSMGFRKPLQVGRREAARPGGSGDMAHPGTSRASRAAAPADTSLIQALPPIAARMQRLIGLCRVCEQAWEIGFLLVFWLPVHSIRHVPDVQRCWLIPPLFKTYLLLLD